MDDKGNKKVKYTPPYVDPMACLFTPVTYTGSVVHRVSYSDGSSVPSIPSSVQINIYNYKSGVFSWNSTVVWDSLLIWGLPLIVDQNSLTFTGERFRDQSTGGSTDTCAIPPWQTTKVTVNGAIKPNSVLVNVSLVCTTTNFTMTFTLEDSEIPIVH